MRFGVKLPTLGAAIVLLTAATSAAAEKVLDFPRFHPKLFDEAKVDEGVTWKDGKELPLEGCGFPDTPLYQRLPERLYASIPRRKSD